MKGGGVNYSFATAHWVHVVRRHCFLWILLILLEFDFLMLLKTTHKSKKRLTMKEGPRKVGELQSLLASLWVWRYAFACSRWNHLFHTVLLILFLYVHTICNAVHAHLFLCFFSQFLNLCSMLNLHFTRVKNHLTYTHNFLPWSLKLVASVK